MLLACIAGQAAVDCPLFVTKLDGLYGRVEDISSFLWDSTMGVATKGCDRSKFGYVSFYISHGVLLAAYEVERART